MNCIDLTSKQSKCGDTSQNYKSNQITMNCIDLMSNDQNVEIRRKTFKTTQNYDHQITMNCIDLMSKRSNQRKTTKVIRFQWIASIWRLNDQNFWRKTTKVIKLQWLHRFDIKTIKNVEIRRKTFKTTQNYESNQITMNCIDLTSKRSKNCWVNVAKLQK